MCVCEREKERERERVCICERERESERESMYIYGVKDGERLQMKNPNEKKKGKLTCSKIGTPERKLRRAKTKSGESRAVIIASPTGFGFSSVQGIERV